MRVQFAHVPQKSGRPSVLIGARQLRVWASIKARVYLPEPGEPETTTACGKRSRPSMSRRRWMVSALPWKSEKAIEHSTAAETEGTYCKSSTVRCADSFGLAADHSLPLDSLTDRLAYSVSLRQVTRCAPATLTCGSQLA